MGSVLDLYDKSYLESEGQVQMEGRRGDKIHVNTTCSFWGTKAEIVPLVTASHLPRSSSKTGMSAVTLCNMESMSKRDWKNWS